MEFSSEDEDALIAASQQVEKLIKNSQEETENFHLYLSDASSEEGEEIPSSQARSSQGGGRGEGGDKSHFSDVSDSESEAFQARFDPPVSDNQLSELLQKDLRVSTKKNMFWAVNLFETWRKQRNGRILKNSKSILSVIPHELQFMPTRDLVINISRFLVEVRKVDGSHYPPKTLRHLVLMLQKFLSENERPFQLLSDPQFSSLQNVLDRMMKKRAQEGLGLNVRKAEVISFEKENYLWSCGLLGQDSPSVLLNTVLFLIGLNFALRSGEEHRSLSRDQLEIFIDSSGQFSYLKYTEKYSKTNKRGLKDYNVSRKIVKAYADRDRPERCIVSLYDKYLKRCSPDVPPDGPVYLTPLKKPKPHQWYSMVPLGKNSLSKIVSQMCSEAGFKGILKDR